MIKFYAVNAVLSVIGYLIFIPRYSYWGAAWMTVFSEAFILFTASYILYRNLKFLPNQKILVKAVASSLIMAIPLFSFPDLPFLVSVCLGGAVYFLALYVFKGLDTKLILEVIKIKKDETVSNQP
jgi:O-antigen/teichoic acid export membrane protein